MSDASVQALGSRARATAVARRPFRALTTAIINTLAAAQSAGRLKREIGRYLRPGLLIIDELGYLPIDGADLLFKIISLRYERAPMVITTNRVTCGAARRSE